jgi:LysR family transcriptional regulator, nitrogen assimilation regulatory protein
MQFRQLRYFVSIVEAGSFSRAASVVHIAQPALSQQIAEMEQRLGVSLLQRSARGVRPTAAGDILYREALVILKQLDRLPTIAKLDQLEPQGAVSLGVIHSLAAKLVGGILDECRKVLPKVSIRISDHDRIGLEGRVSSGSIDFAVLYEDEPLAALRRKPLFTQKMYLISRDPVPGCESTISLERIAQLPLVVPGPSSTRRMLIDRVFAAANLKPNIALEAESLSTAMWAVRSGSGCAIVSMGDMSQFGPDVFSKPLLVQPEISLVCLLVHSADFPLSPAAEAVQKLVVEFLERRIRQPDMPGTHWIAQTAI